MQGDRLAEAVAAIDAVNAEDPTGVVPAHAELASAWLGRLRPDADEALVLAVRAHHIRRWAIPRRDYPDGRAGYLRWRTALKALHAEEAGRVLSAVGYGDDVVGRVQDILRKRGLGHDDDVQVFEDVLCLVFLETQLHELAERLGPGHIVEVVRKTLPKMSEEARGLALGLDLQPGDRAVLEAAVRA